MLNSMLYSPNTPNWLVTTTLILGLIIMIGLLAWGVILQLRYYNPYKLISTPERDKWRKAAILALIYISTIPIFGLIIPIISPRSNQWPFIPLCFAIWIALLPLGTAYFRWDYERKLKQYRRIDRWVKGENNLYERLFSFPLTKWIGNLIPADHKRFYFEGYPEEVYKETDSTPEEEN